ncbi:uncharacterized protein LOC127786712 isoform X2 [Diospyros lotus]|uniref:uncharacterized protein LOC127786712 isoform X2 n=1 Tax=Diospyros lotus TaxID=55363 RepID=UPI002253F522|nr:uncharacterized protein LOC127786712 isoform X2 [Diospyros lotus]
MGITEFAMVEELAFLVKDNLPCKHLVLSMEEAFINFLQDDPSLDAVLELEPMSPYNRLLLHRLADIFGFSHHSVGEGDERHLLLERSPETSIPPILVSDLLWQYDELHPPTTSHQLLRRSKASPAKVEKSADQFSLKEREAAYLAARERIFTRYDDEINEPVKPKPRSIPVVARRMIAHALGQRISPSNQAVRLKDAKENGQQTKGTNIQGKEQENTNLRIKHGRENSILSGQTVTLYHKPKVRNFKGGASLHDEKIMAPRQADKTAIEPRLSQPRRSEAGVYRGNLKEEHMGAAKRIFAHAMRFHSVKEGMLSRRNGVNQDK